MKPAGARVRSPLKTHGGKAYLARRIVGLLPPHRVYCEPFAGGLNVLLNKPRSAVEVAGDADPELDLFWRAFADPARFPDLLGRVAGVLYAVPTFEAARMIVEDAQYGGVDPVGFAAAYLIRNRMSRNGYGRTFGWSERLRGKTQVGGAIPGDANAWRTMVADLDRVHRRVAGLDFRCGDGAALVRAVDAPDAVLYLDPPYMLETRTVRTVYGRELTPSGDVAEDRRNHAVLLDVVLGCRGAVFLSGYHSDLYDRTLGRAGWRVHEFPMPNHAGQGKTKQRRLECVWTNRP